MQVAALCKRDVVHIGAGATLTEAAGLMREQHVGCLVVTADVKGRSSALGVVTDRDLVIEVLARGPVPAGMTVGQLVGGKPVGVRGDASLVQAAAAMQAAGVRRLLVTGETGQVVGLLSADDLLAAMAAELGALAQALRSGIARESAERGPLEPRRPAAPVFLPHGTPGMHWSMTAQPPSDRDRGVDPGQGSPADRH